MLTTFDRCARKLGRIDFNVRQGPHGGFNDDHDPIVTNTSSDLCVERQTGGRPPAVVADRVVHGSKYTTPVCMDARVLTDLKFDDCSAQSRFLPKR